MGEPRLPGFELNPQLEQLGPEAVRRVMDRYLNNIAELEAAIADAIAAGDGPALEESAHSLKGSSGAVGANRVMEICLEIEALARRGAVGEARAWLPELRQQHETIRGSWGEDPQ